MSQATSVFPCQDIQTFKKKKKNPKIICPDGIAFHRTREPKVLDSGFDFPASPGLYN